MAELYATIENPLVGVLAEMEYVGIAVDMTELKRLNQHLTSESERLAAELQRVVGRPVNFNSPVAARAALHREQLAPQRRPRPGIRPARRHCWGFVMNGRSSSIR
jgi:DNA polymerase-1